MNISRKLFVQSTHVYQLYYEAIGKRGPPRVQKARVPPQDKGLHVLASFRRGHESGRRSKMREMVETPCSCTETNGSAGSILTSATIASHPPVSPVLHKPKMIFSCFAFAFLIFPFIHRRPPPLHEYHRRGGRREGDGTEGNPPDSLFLLRDVLRP